MRSKVLAALVAFTVIAAVDLVVASPALAVGVRIFSKNEPGRCMLVRGTADEAPVVGESCATSYPDQGWNLTCAAPPCSNPFWIKSSNSNKCLLVRSWGPNANKAVQYPCMDYPDQKWTVAWNVGLEYMQFQNVASYLCLVMRSWQHQLEVSECDYKITDQRFTQSSL